MALDVVEAVDAVPEVDMEATQLAMCQPPQLKILGTSPLWVASEIHHCNLHNGSLAWNSL